MLYHNTFVNLRGSQEQKIGTSYINKAGEICIVLVSSTASTSWKTQTSQISSRLTLLMIESSIKCIPLLWVLFDPAGGPFAAEPDGRHK